MPSKHYVLDSYALLAMLEDQPGAERVAEIISSPGGAVYLSVINLGEVLYIVERRRSTQAASEVAGAVVATEEIQLVDATFERTQIAANVKARGGLSYADCFAVALAQETGGTIITGDPEYAKVEKEIRVEWLP